jgi:hypothetical protein
LCSSTHASKLALEGGKVRLGEEEGGVVTSFESEAWARKNKFVPRVNGSEWLPRGAVEPISCAPPAWVADGLERRVQRRLWARFDAGCGTAYSTPDRQAGPSVVTNSAPVQPAGTSSSHLKLCSADRSISQGLVESLHSEHIGTAATYLRLRRPRSSISQVYCRTALCLRSR